MRPPEEEEPPPGLPLDPPPPVHEPALQVCPLNVQSLQVTPPVPHALSEPVVSQEPLGSQHPVQLVESHVVADSVASSPVLGPPEVLVVAPVFPELLDDCDPYDVPAPESSPLPPEEPPPELAALDPPPAPDEPKLE